MNLKDKSVPWLRHSNAANEACQRRFQCRGNSDQRIKRDVFLSPLHVADVSRIKLRPFRKFFLAHTGQLAMNTDVFTQNAPMFWKGTHNNNRNRNRVKRPSDIPESFCLCGWVVRRYNGFNIGHENQSANSGWGVSFPARKTCGVYFQHQNFHKSFRDTHPIVTIASSASLVNQQH